MTPNKIKVVVSGALGRMGQSLIQVINKRSDMVLAGAIERPGMPQIGRDLSLLIPGLGDGNGVLLSDSLSHAGKDADVYIDFSSVESSLKYLDEAINMNIAAVIGTTGFDQQHKSQLKKAGESIALLWAPNMSTGVAVMNKIAALMTKMLGSDYDIEIVEAHHKLKKDAPSGTAIKLYESVAGARQSSSKAVTGRSGICGERGQEEIGLMALRGGDIIGDHSIHYCGPGERLELTHRAQTRDTFAQGAVRAAAWLAGRKAGLYSIEDTMEA